jgi:hypothetical protein
LNSSYISSANNSKIHGYIAGKTSPSKDKKKYPTIDMGDINLNLPLISDEEESRYGRSSKESRITEEDKEDSLINANPQYRYTDAHVTRNIKLNLIESLPKTNNANTLKDRNGMMSVRSHSSASIVPVESK